MSRHGRFGLICGFLFVHIARFWQNQNVGGTKKIVLPDAGCGSRLIGRVSFYYEQKHLIFELTFELTIRAVILSRVHQVD